LRVIGMFLAVPGMVPWRILLAGTVGIALVAGAAAAANCLIEQKIDALMARTRGRPLPLGEVNSLETLLVSGLMGGTGLFLLYAFVNPFTMWLTFATFVGYAVIYTVFLKPNTSQNIVIGGASGAMPPVLGWAAVTGDAPGEAWLLFLIIFVWTPPHFWSLALYRTKEYAAAGLPMLPVTHGAEYTRRHVFFYTVGLTLVTLVPWVIGMSGCVLPDLRSAARHHFPRLCMADLARLFRCRGAHHFPLVDPLPRTVVRCAADRSLPAVLSKVQGAGAKTKGSLR
jgi:protoheme IX farnesyltransferase